MLTKLWSSMFCTRRQQANSQSHNTRTAEKPWLVSKNLVVKSPRSTINETPSSHPRKKISFKLSHNISAVRNLCRHMSLTFPQLQTEKPRSSGCSWSTEIASSSSWLWRGSLKTTRLRWNNIKEKFTEG